MTIDCDTPVSSIISLNDVNPIITGVKDEVDSYVSLITAIIKAEESDGGLSTSAYYIDDRAELNVLAIDLLNNLKIAESFKNCKEDIINAVKIQRTRELSILKEEVYNKMISLRNERNNLYNSDDYNSVTEIDDEYNFYYSKYNMLEGML